MKQFVLVFFLFVSSLAFADDPCLGDEEQKETAALKAKLAQVEKNGSSEEKFKIYKRVVSYECSETSVIKNSQEKLIRIGKDLGQKSEAKGQLYPGTSSAFYWYENAGLKKDSERVLLKAVKADSKNLGLFKNAMEVANNHGPEAAALKMELQKIATITGEGLLAQEEQEVGKLSADFNTATSATIASQEKLRLAQEWLSYTPKGNGVIKKIAEKRGDTIAARPDKVMSSHLAQTFYELAGADAKLKAQKDQSKVFEKKMEKSSEGLKKSFKESSAAESKNFKKGADDLEKELDF